MVAEFDGDMNKNIGLPAQLLRKHSPSLFDEVKDIGNAHHPAEAPGEGCDADPANSGPVSGINAETGERFEAPSIEAMIEKILTSESLKGNDMSKARLICAKSKHERNFEKCKTCKFNIDND